MGEYCYVVRASDGSPVELIPVEGAFTCEWYPDRLVVTEGRRVAEGERIAAAFGFWWHDERLHYHRSDRKRMRCPACHPLGCTPKLCIDGREYARRRRARGRRR